MSEALVNEPHSMLFSAVKYCLSSSLPQQRQEELRKLLDANGGRRVDVKEATHILSNSDKFERQEEAAKDVVIVSVRFLIFLPSSY